MKSAADVILALEATPGRLDKESIIRQAWDAGILEFFEGAQLAYDALRTFGVKQVPLITEGEDDPSVQSAFTWIKFKELVRALETRKLTGNAARDAMRAAADAAPIRDWNGFYRRVLLKDFKCGVTDGTINKVLSKAGPKAQPYIIPVFSCQLAKDGEENPRHMKGQKLLDIKLDGVRILAFLDKERNEVVLRTREGRIKENFPQIEAKLAKLIPHIKESMVFDGEMVSKNFQALMRQLNRGTDVDTGDAKFALFDLLPVKDFMFGKCSLTQVQRHEALVQFIPLLDQYGGGSLYVVPKLECNLDTNDGQAKLREFNTQAVSDGYEGIMIKDPNAPYVTDRVVAWLKIKPTITIDLTCTGFEQGKAEGKNSDTLGAMIGETVHDGKKIVCAVGGGYSDDLRDWIWANRDKVKGFVFEAEADAITKPQKGDVHGLRFPRFVRFRGFEPGEKM